MLAQQILSDLNLARLADLAARKRAGHLTPLEALALCALRGGPEAEAAAPALLDEALATYGHGGYRVPVRFVADPKRLLLIATTSVAMDQADNAALARHLEAMLARMASPAPGHASVVVVPAGSKLDVYEVAEPERAGVRVEPEEKSE